MSSSQYAFAALSLRDFKEKMRITQKRLRQNEESISASEQQLKMIENRVKRLKNERIELEKQMNKFDSLIEHTQNTINNMGSHHKRRK